MKLKVIWLEMVGDVSEVLVIDTSTNAVSVACGSSKTDVSHRCVSQLSSHSENILTAINEILNERSKTMSDISAIGVGIGPGLFTGLRVGITAAHAFAQALEIPLEYFSSLELTALSSIPQQGPKTQEILVGRDARRHELYYAHYDSNRVESKQIVVDTTEFSTRLVRKTPEGLISPKSLVEKANSNPHCLIVIDDLTIYEEFVNLLPDTKKRVVQAKLDASAMIDHVIESVMASNLANIYQPSALYVRKSDAELSWGSGK